MFEVWLKCEEKPGMFSDEVVVMVTTVHGEVREYVVPTDHVDDGRVRIKAGLRDGILWAKLPTDHPYHAIPIRRGDLIEDPIPA
jgi:hypothetical protein